MLRVTRPGGLLALVDVCASEDADEAGLHNALEQLRDPTHVRMLPPSELTSFAMVRCTGWITRAG